MAETTEKEQKEKKNPHKHHRRYQRGPALGGTLWFAGWLFTIGFADLVWWKIILGIVVWPYFLALALK